MLSFLMLKFNVFKSKYFQKVSFKSVMSFFNTFCKKLMCIDIFQPIFLFICVKKGDKN